MGPGWCANDEAGWGGRPCAGHQRAMGSGTQTLRAGRTGAPPGRRVRPGTGSSIGIGVAQHWGAQGGDSASRQSEGGQVPGAGSGVSRL